MYTMNNLIPNLSSPSGETPTAVYIAGGAALAYCLLDSNIRNAVANFFDAVIEGFTTPKLPCAITAMTATSTLYPLDSNLPLVLDSAKNSLVFTGACATISTVNNYLRGDYVNFQRGLLGMSVSTAGLLAIRLLEKK